MAVILVFGGANWTMPFARLVAEIAGAAMLCAALALPWQGRAGGLTVTDKLLLALAALFALHLLPLPPAVWTALPGRETAALADKTVFGATGWRPLSLDPQATWRSALMLLPAFAAYLAVRLGDAQRCQALLRGVALAMAAAIAIAFAQLALPDAAWLRFFPVGDYEQPVGFFTNRNHQATFLLTALALCAAWQLGRAGERYSHPGWLAGLAALASAAALATGSRSGAALLPLALGGVVLAWPAMRTEEALGRKWRRLALLGGGAMTAALAIVALGGDGLVSALHRDAISNDSRFAFWPLVVSAAIRFWPIGSGIGTFLDAYEAHEPIEALSPLYLNHAHNDFLEILLEAGVPGLVLALVGTWEIGLLAKRAWRRTGKAPGVNQARMAAVAAALPLLHSMVDYPLRTVAISTLFALAAALLVSDRDGETG